MNCCSNLSYNTAAVSRILTDTEKIMDQEAIRAIPILSEEARCEKGGSLLHLSALEPTPIGPMGVEKIVEFVPISDSILPAEDIVDSLVVSSSPASTSASDGSLEKLRQSIKYDHFSRLSHHDQPGQQRASWTTSTRSSISRSNSFQLNHAIDSNKYATLEDDDEDVFMNKFRHYQSEHWIERFADLIQFRQEYGHCFVPHNFRANPALAKWVKRQRYQYKLKHEKKHSTLTDEREACLQSMGFVWDSHRAIWEERYRMLWHFRETRGHSNVPSNYHNKGLAIWVKCKCFFLVPCGNDTSISLLEHRLIDFKLYTNS